MYGEIDASIQLGNMEYHAKVVADLGGKTAILGMNFIESYDIVLRLSYGKIYIGDETVSLHRENAKKSCCRISLGETLSIPPRSCRVVAAEVDIGKLASGRTALKEGSVECLPTLAAITGIVMDRGLVKVQQGMIPVNLINVHDEPILFHKGKTLGQLQTLKTVGKVNPIKKSCREKEKSKTYTRDDIPEPTRPVLEGADELTAEQVSDVCELILDYTERFKEPGKKGGRTGLKLGMGSSPV